MEIQLPVSDESYLWELVNSTNLWPTIAAQNLLSSLVL